MYETQLKNTWINFHKGRHDSLVNFFIRIDALVAEFKSKFGVMKKGCGIISLVGLKLTGDTNLQCINYVSASEDREPVWKSIKRNLIRYEV